MQLIISLSWISHLRKWKMHLSMFLKLVVKCVCDCRLSTQFSNNSYQSTKHGTVKKVFLARIRQLQLLYIWLFIFPKLFKLGAHSWRWNNALQTLSICSYFWQYSLLENLLWFLSVETANPAHWVYHGFLRSQEYK